MIFVRRVGLGDQVLSEPEPWASSGALALGLGFGLCPLGWKKLSEPNPTATLLRSGYGFVEHVMVR
jgi:hypothetical protein